MLIHMLPHRGLQVHVRVLNDKQVLALALANTLSLKEKKNAWLAFVVFNPDNVFPAFKTFFCYHSLKEPNFIHNKNLLYTIPLSPYNYSQHFGIIFVTFITMLAFPTSHFYILNIGTNFKLIEPLMSDHSITLKSLHLPFTSVYNSLFCHLNVSHTFLNLILHLH